MKRAKALRHWLDRATPAYWKPRACWRVRAMRDGKHCRTVTRNARLLLLRMDGASFLLFLFGVCVVNNKVTETINIADDDGDPACRHSAHDV